MLMLEEEWTLKGEFIFVWFERYEPIYRLIYRLQMSLRCSMVYVFKLTLHLPL